MGAVVVAALQPFTEPLNNCCKFVLNDMEVESNCGCSSSPCGCHVVTHQVDVDDSVVLDDCVVDVDENEKVD